MPALLAELPPWLLVLAAIAGAAAVAGVVVALATRPTVTIAVLFAVTLTGISAAFERGPLGLATLALLAAGCALVLGLRQGTVRLVASPVWGAVALYVAVTVLSLTQARDLGASGMALYERVRDLAVLGVALPLLAAVPRLRPVVAAVVIAVASLAGLTMIQELVLENSSELGGLARVPIAEEIGAATARHSGPLSDVNFWGRLLLLTLPLAFALGSSSNRRNWPWLAAAGVIAAGIYLTGSRGALLATGVTVIVWLVLVTPRRRTLLLLGVAAIALLAVPGVLSRLATLAAANSADTAIEDPSLLNRAAVQIVGLAMARDHPVLGVGLGNFLVREPEYQRATGEAITEGVIAPHNLYLELLAETGFLGLVSWLVLLGVAAYLATRAYVVSRRLGALQPGMPLPARLSAAVLAGLAGWSAASVALHLAEFAALLCMIALAAALDIRTRRDLAATDRLLLARADAIRAATPSRTWHRALALVAVVSAAGSVVLALQPTSWRASTTVSVVPNAVADASPAYAYDVRSRDQLIPTYAGFVRSPGLIASAIEALDLALATEDVQISARPRRSTALIDVQVTSTDRETARALAPAVLDAAARRLAAIDPLYRLEPADDPVEVRPVSPPLGGPSTFAAITLLAGAGAVIDYRRARRRAARSAAPSTEGGVVGGADQAQVART